MATKERLSRERIILVALQLVQEEGPDGLTMRRLGERLSVDGTALYRHFRNKDELVRVLGDRILEGVVPETASGSWQDRVRAICVRLRLVLIEQSDLGGWARSEPTRQHNELVLTEAMLGHLEEAGFTPADAARAYHALIELTVGSAAIDAALSRLPDTEREKAYAQWRREYAALDPAEFPVTPKHAAHMYIGTATDRFEDVLDALLDGLASRLSG